MVQLQCMVLCSILVTMLTLRRGLLQGQQLPHTAQCLDLPLDDSLCQWLLHMSPRNFKL